MFHGAIVAKAYVSTYFESLRESFKPVPASLAVIRVFPAVLEALLCIHFPEITTQRIIIIPIDLGTVPRYAAVLNPPYPRRKM